MDKNPLITIGIPVFNASAYIEDCLRSVMNQSFTDFEVIITDDGSTDRTADLVRSFKDNRIIFLEDKKNLGISARINQQVDLARGTFFCRMDADDIMFVNRLQTQIDFMKHNPEVDVIGSQAVVIDELNQLIGYRFCRPDFSRQSILREILFIHPTVFGKTSWFKQYRYCNTYNGVEDFLLWNTSFEPSHFHVLPMPLLFYRDPVSSDASKYLFRQSRIRKVFRRLYELELISLKQLMLLKSKSMSKSIAYGILSVAGLHKLLIRRRNIVIDQRLNLIYSQELKNSINQVPTS